MKKIVFLLALACIPWAAVHFGAPKWGQVLACVPFFLLAISMGDADENSFGEASEGVGKAGLLFLGVGGLVLGMVGVGLKDTSSLFGLIAWTLPVSVLVTAVALYRIFRS